MCGLVHWKTSPLVHCYRSPTCVHYTDPVNVNLGWQKLVAGQIYAYLSTLPLQT